MREGIQGEIDAVHSHCSDYRSTMELPLSLRVLLSEKEAKKDNIATLMDDSQDTQEIDVMNESTTKATRSHRKKN